MKQLISFMEGKKTYAVATLAVVWAVAGTVLGYLDPQEAFNIVLAALGGAGLRASK